MNDEELFEKNIAPLQIQKNNREIELIVKECILNSIRDSIPVETILKAYMDETYEEGDASSMYGTINNIVRHIKTLKNRKKEQHKEKTKSSGGSKSKKKQENKKTKNRRK